MPTLTLRTILFAAVIFVVSVTNGTGQHAGECDARVDCFFVGGETDCQWRYTNWTVQKDSVGFFLRLAPDSLTGTILSDWLCSTQSHNSCLRFHYKMNNERNTLRVYLTHGNSATTKLLLTVTYEVPTWKEVNVPVTATERFKILIAGEIKPGSNTGISVDFIDYLTYDCYVDKATTTGTVVPYGSTSPSLSWSHSATIVLVATDVVAIVVVVAVLSVYVMKRKYSRRPAENADEHSEGAPLRHQFAPSRPGIPSLHSVHNYSDIEDVNVSENTGEHRNPRVASDGYLEPHPRMNSAPTRAQVNATASGDIGNTDPGEASNYTHLNPRDEAAAGDHYTPLRLLGQGGDSSDYTQLGPREENPEAGSDGAYTPLMPVGLSGDCEISGSGGEGNDEYQDDYIAMGPVRRHNPVYENSA